MTAPTIQMPVDSFLSAIRCRPALDCCETAKWCPPWPGSCGAPPASLIVELYVQSRGAPEPAIQTRETPFRVLPGEPRLRVEVSVPQLVTRHQVMPTRDRAASALQIPSDLPVDSRRDGHQRNCGRNPLMDDGSRRTGNLSRLHPTQRRLPCRSQNAVRQQKCALVFFRLDDFANAGDARVRTESYRREV
jgi:hypothetical protein